MSSYFFVSRHKKYAATSCDDTPLAWQWKWTVGTCRAILVNIKLSLRSLENGLITDHHLTKMYFTLYQRGNRMWPMKVISLSPASSAGTMSTSKTMQQFNLSTLATLLPLGIDDMNELRLRALL